jgi:hypothetical protein
MQKYVSFIVVEISKLCIEEENKQNTFTESRSAAMLYNI